jgi:Gpi18-like mannosyltransferase
MRKLLKNRIFWIFFTGLLIRLILLPLGFHPDVRNHVDWGMRFFQYGLGEFYQANIWSYSWPNQPPGTIYIFAFLKLLYDGIFAGLWFLNLKIPLFPSFIFPYLEHDFPQVVMKIPSTLADLGVAALIFLILKKFATRKGALIGASFYLFNPVTFYNSSFWGQTDALVFLFALFSFWLLFLKKPILSTTFFAFSLYIKATLVIFAPIFLLYLVKEKYSLKTLIFAILIPIALIWLLTIPFSGPDAVSWLYYLYKDKVFGGQLQYLTANAFNIWALGFGLDPKPDWQNFLFLPLKIWSILTFGLLFLFYLWRMLKEKNFPRLFFIILFLVSFSAFMILTAIHERYLFPAFPTLSVLVGFQPFLIFPGAIMSLIHLANLYNFWWVPRIEFLVFAFTIGDKIIPKILSLANVALFFFFFKALIFPKRETV